MMGQWTKLSETDAATFYRGTIFRTRAKWPFDDVVDFGLLDEHAFEQRHLSLWILTGRKAGCRTQTFPSEASDPNGNISGDWMRNNWTDWIHPESTPDEVWVSESYGVPQFPPRSDGDEF